MMWVFQEGKSYKGGMVEDGQANKLLLHVVITADGRTWKFGGEVSTSATAFDISCSQLSSTFKW